MHPHRVGGAMSAVTLDILDVGQGDGMLLTFPNGKTMMVDLGSTRNKDLVSADCFTYFQKHTKFATPGETLDYLVLTHGDKDHYNMLAPFVERFRPRIRNVIHGGAASEYTLLKGQKQWGATNLVEWLTGYMRATYNEAVTTLTGAQRFPMGVGPGENSVREFGAEVMILCMSLDPHTAGEAYNKNTKSVVLQVRYPPNRADANVILLAGDSTRHTEDAIQNTFRTVGALTPEMLRSDVLKLGHHGSHRTSNHANWLATVNPQYVFVCSDRAGSLDEVQKPSGHRLPQHLTMDLVQKYCTRLVTDTPTHQYVTSMERADYVEYNKAPDIPGQTLPPPPSDKWCQNSNQLGIFSTLASLGPGDGDADRGAQYRVVMKDDGALDILSTLDFASFDALTGQYDEMSDL